ncbi:MAG: HD-GYP domain-containing protein, partial [Actinomycetota bacterium]|nr:HD-GYP domain-containing protein [Actinomycetota bacterium]
MAASGVVRSDADRWKRRRGLATLIRVVVVLAPVVVATDVGLLIANALPTPEGAGPTIGWWASVLGASLAALLGFDRLFRRLLPLSVLLNLALVFPGVAPSRFSAAFRAGTARNLQRRIDQAKVANDSDASAAAGTVVELIAALAAHDPRTRGHSERTRAYAELIGEELGLASDELDRLRWSALLHDIGKLHVEPTLLNKSGRPDPAEWEVLRSHPIEGARIAGALRHWLGPWGLAIEQHHERFDGTGYPAGLGGENISLGGRIVSVADAYEVMTSSRSYTPPVAPAAAREELVRCAGNHFDPVIVRAFLRIAIGRFPKGAGLLVALGQVPGFMAAQRVLERAGSAVVAAAVGGALAAVGVVSPSGGTDLGRPSGEVASSGDTTDRGEGAGGKKGFVAPVLPKTTTTVVRTTTATPPTTTAELAAGGPAGGESASPPMRMPPPPG